MTPNSPLLIEADLRTRAIAWLWAGSTWLQSSALAELAVVTASDVDSWLAHGKVVAICFEGQRYVPRYTLDRQFRPLPCIADILQVFANRHSVLSIATWFESTSSFLCGARPRELLTTDPQRVIAAAQDSIANERNF